MHTNTILLIIGIGLAAGIGGYALHSSTATQSGMMSGDVHHMSDSSMMDHGAHNDSDMMDHMDGMMVESERAFIEGMIPHHQEAVDTAKEVIERGGTTPEIQQLVEDIVVAQEREIATMRQWHQDWYGEPYSDSGDYVPMMRDLSQLSGVALDHTFLEDMVMHHMGAIMMARSVQPYIEHTEVEELTKAIVATQSDEIRLMRLLLGGL